MPSVRLLPNKALPILHISTLIRRFKSRICNIHFSLLLKTALLAKRVRDICLDYLPEQANQLPTIDIKSIKKTACDYFFTKLKTPAQKLRRESLLKTLWQEISRATVPLINTAKQLMEPFLIESMPKRQCNLLTQFTQKAPQIIEGLFERCFESLPRKIRLYSYFRDDVHCFNKLKMNKACQFGRQFQIGRVGGNFLFSMPNSSLQMVDPAHIKSMIAEHIQTFQTPIESISTDKGYYSKANEQLALDFHIEQVGIQRPVRKLIRPPDNPTTHEQLQQLYKRRCGIEPLIGHLKRGWQMGRSRMKSDRTTEASGFASILGFNLRQLSRYLTDHALMRPA